jgi:hypothetical protein
MAGIANVAEYDKPTEYTTKVMALEKCPKCGHVWAAHTNCYTTDGEDRFGCNMWKLGGNTQQSNQDRLCHCMNRPDGTAGVGHPGYEIDGSDIEWED